MWGEEEGEIIYIFLKFIFNLFCFWGSSLANGQILESFTNMRIKQDKNKARYRGGGKCVGFCMC